MKILITGLNGMLGSFLSRELIKDGHTLHGTVRSKESNHSLIEDIKDIIPISYIDIRDFSELGTSFKPDFVIHTAALVSFSPKDTEQLMDININGTIEVTKYCLKKNCKLIHISSVAAIGRSKKNEHITERNQWIRNANNNNYGISKYYSELEVVKASLNGLKYYCINPSIILGKGIEGKGSFKIFTEIKKGLKFYPTGSSGFVGLHDISLFTKLCLTGKVPINERFILNSFNIKYKKLFDLIAKSYEIKAPTIKIDGILKSILISLSKLLQLLGTKPFINSNSINSASNNISYSNEKSLSISDMSYQEPDELIKEVCN